jgi:hypothetical protein
MIISTISYRVAPGKNLEATEYLQRIAREVKKVTGTNVRLTTQLAGPAGHYVLSSEYESIGKWDEGRNKVQDDSAFQKLVIEAGTSGLFLPGTTQMAIWQQI